MKKLLLTIMMLALPAVVWADAGNKTPTSEAKTDETPAVESGTREFLASRTAKREAFRKTMRAKRKEFRASIKALRPEESRPLQIKFEAEQAAARQSFRKQQQSEKLAFLKEHPEAKRSLRRHAKKKAGKTQNN